MNSGIRMRRDVYSGTLRLNGKEDKSTLVDAFNYAASLVNLGRFEEAKALLRKTMPVARRVLGEGHDITLRMRWYYAMALYMDEGATLDDLREAVTTLEDTARRARRALGSAHPIATGLGFELPRARAALDARETPKDGLDDVEDA